MWVKIHWYLICTNDRVQKHKTIYHNFFSIYSTCVCGSAKTFACRRLGGCCSRHDRSSSPSPRSPRSATTTSQRSRNITCTPSVSGPWHCPLAGTVYSEMIFICWTFNFMLFLSRTIDKLKIPTKYLFTFISYVETRICPSSSNQGISCP